MIPYMSGQVHLLSTFLRKKNRRPVWMLCILSTERICPLPEAVIPNAVVSAAAVPHDG